MLRKIVEQIINQKIAEHMSTIEQASNLLEKQQIAYNNAIIDNETLKKKYEQAISDHITTLEQYQKEIELQKIYIYLIPKLIESSGLEIPEGFDITNYNDAKSLYTRYMNKEIY